MHKWSGTKASKKAFGSSFLFEMGKAINYASWHAVFVMLQEGHAY